jgi:hypothetical protein
MKNFPDQNQFHDLVKRLQSYTEQPDEILWKNIDAALRPNRTFAWVPWVDRATMAIIVVLAFLFVNTENQLNPKFQTVAHPKNLDSLYDSSNAFTPPSKNSKQAADSHLSSRVNEGKENIRDKVFPQFGSDKSDSGSDLNGIASIEGIVDSTHQVEQGKSLKESYKADSLLVSPLEVKQDSAENFHGEKETKRVRKKRLAFYAQITPMLSFQRATPVSRDGVIVTELFNRSILSSDRFSLSLEAGVQGFISKRFEYYGGVSLYKQRQSLRYAYHAVDQVTVESNGEKNYTVTPKSSTAIVNYHMMNVGVNAGLIYSLYGKRLIHKIGTGLSYQRGFNQSDAEVYDNAESSYLSYQLFYRNEISVNRRLRIYIQPTFMHSFHVNEKLDAPFTLKPYSAGIGFGILYNF